MSQTIGHGSKLQYGSGGNSETFTDVACMSIDFGSNKVDTPDNTDMLTPGTTRTYIAGLENPGDVTAKINVKPGDAGQTGLRALKGAANDFKVVYPGAVRTRAFSGIITSIDESIPDDKLPTITVKIQITGPVTDS